jgi:fructosamine-3-kinase
MAEFETALLLPRAIENAISQNQDPRFASPSNPSCTIHSFERLSGGCISNAARITLSDGQRYFVKYCPHDLEMYEAERDGLDAIRATQTLRIPQVIGIGKSRCGNSFLILEAIEAPNASSISEIEFARSLAQLHRKTQSTRFGYPRSNFIGSTIQVNTWADDWQTFFVENRLRPQIKMAQNRRLTTRLFDRYAGQLLSKIGNIINDPSPPVLIHGDLWAGNVIVAKNGLPVLIDPAVSYSNRELEFGMTTLFGEFGTDFYDAYNECWPLLDGWQERVKLYQLYHLLNHLNLFGRTYFEACMNTLKRFA